MKSFIETFFAMILTMFTFSVSAQQTTIAKYIITDASDNGINITPTILDQGAYIDF